MYCQKCGTENPNDAKFCKSCGKELNASDTKDENTSENNNKEDFNSQNLTAGQIIGFLVVGILPIAFLAMNDIDEVSTKPSHVSPSQAQHIKQTETSDDQLLKQIWNAYHNIPGNKDADDRNEKGRIVKRGTVPPSAVNSSVDGKLPAYVACYDFIMVTSFGDSKAHLCIYYINNPSIGRSSMQWRGNVHDLEEFMRNDGFVEK